MADPDGPVFPLRDLLDFEIESGDGTCRAWLEVGPGDLPISGKCVGMACPFRGR